MAMTVQTNTAAITALKHLNTNSANMNRSLERLSSGFRVNSAADDAAGYAIASKLDAQSSRLAAASQNASQATAMVKMADAGVNEIQNMIVRIQTLATQASSANNTNDIAKIEGERVKLEQAIDKIANSSNYNGINLLNGIDANSAAVTGTKATVGAELNVAASQTAGGLTSASTGALFSEAATFTIQQDAAGKITSITSSVDLHSINDGTLIASANTNLITAQAAVGALNVTAIGLTFTSTAPTAGGTPAASTNTLAFTAGTAYTAGGQSAYAGALAFQVGADNNANNQVTVDLTKSYTTSALGLNGSATAAITDQATAQAYITTAQNALDTLITQRADLGATQNQLGFVQANLSTSIEQAKASVSSIRDADMAAEMADFTKNQILVQASTSMLAQANQAAQNVLSLFR